MTKAVALATLSLSVVHDLKHSPAVWENARAKASTLSTQLTALSTAMDEFVSAIESISDNAMHIKGATRDCGMILTKFCMRQKKLQGKLQALATAINDQFAMCLSKKSAQWRQQLAKRTDKKLQQKKTKCSKNAQQPVIGEALDQLRNECEELLLERREQHITFLNLLLPILNLEVELGDEMEQLNQLARTMEAVVDNDNPRLVVANLLEDFCTTSALHAIPSEAVDHFGGNHIGHNASRHRHSEEAVFHTMSRCTDALKEGDVIPSAVEPKGVGGRRWITMKDNSVSQHSETLEGACPTSTMPPPPQNQYDVPRQQANSLNRSTIVSISPATHNFCPPMVNSYHGGFGCEWRNSMPRQSPASYLHPPAQQRLPLHNSAHTTVQLQPLCRRSGSVSSLHRSPQVHYRPQACVSSRPPRRPVSLIEGYISTRMEPLEWPRTMTSLTTRDSLKEAAAMTSGDTASSALIAETLNQIDRLGHELDSFCSTLKPLGASQQAISSSAVYTNSSAAGSSSASLDAPHFTRPPPPAYLNNVRYRPGSLRPPPPLPERR